jgi:hypothetical protein
MYRRKLATRQTKNRFGVFPKLLRDHSVLRELDLIERFLCHGLSFFC